MSNSYYSDERGIQMMIYLMKKHGIKRVIASPGATNVIFVTSLQNDPYFEMYSVVDERSAAYLACGLAEETGEPVAITCTGATSSRNYLPGLTEAFYRKIPVLAITAAQHETRIGQLTPQMLDRRSQLNDIVKMSVQVPKIQSAEDEWGYGVKINDALLELRKDGGGPVHINLTTSYSKDYSVKEIKPVPVIHRYTYDDALPEINADQVAIFIGAHSVFTPETTAAIEAFCERYNGVVWCDRTSNYHGKYRVFPSIVCGQDVYESPLKKPDLMIHIGEVSGAYLKISPKNVWRVSPDGCVRDYFRKLSNVFEMSDLFFFKSYAGKREGKNTAYYEKWKQECSRVRSGIPELPFSNLWIAQHTIDKIPEGAVLHVGILNSLRAWNMFEGPEGMRSYCNTGGFGIDGNTSTLIGASLANPEKLYFGIVGDLSFFYDMNSLGIRHIGKNIRLMVVNNGRGTEFRNYSHSAAHLGEKADEYVAAAGHYGNKNPALIRDYAKALGYTCLSATNKEEYLQAVDQFVNPQIGDRMMVFEVFTDTEDESNALRMINHIEKSAKSSLQQQTKQFAKSFLGKQGLKMAKSLIKK
ncbi:thiamine pyrophosphate-binding protein [Ruminococcus sp.]|uniref:thiamine pyrophosphate-binding protein n=1 Tax=Ruminococcus sp. TaxID=41978 RepID=UPI00388EDB0C